jgi:hypothetical protein
MPWNTRLRHPITLADGRTLRTLSDARDMVLSLPQKDQLLQKWQRLADLLMRTARADNASLTAVTTAQIEETLRWPPYGTVRLADEGMDKKPAAPSVGRKARRRKVRRLS